MLILAIILMMTGRLRLDVAAISMAAVLGVMQWLGWGFLGPANSPAETLKAISGFSQPVVITLISLFIITFGLEKSGLIRYVSHFLLRLGGHKQSLLIALFAGVTALLSLFMNNLAAGALLLPGVLEVSRRTGIKPSKLLIPVAYGSLLGGVATYFTTANIIVSDLLTIASPPQPALHIMDFTPTGGLIAAAGILFLGLFGSRLLPDREPSSSLEAGRLTGTELERLYRLDERLWQAVIPPLASFAGANLVQARLGADFGLTVAAILHEGFELVLPSPEEMLQPGDRLLLIGREDKINLLRQRGLEIEAVTDDLSLSRRGLNLVEMILSPHSNAAGQTLKQLDFRGRYRATVLALKRLERCYRTDVGDINLAPGDSLLVITGIPQVKQLKKDADFLVIEPDPGDRPLNRRMAIVVSGVMLAAIAASIAGAPVYLCMLSGAALLLLLGLISAQEAYLSVEWQAVFLIAGMYVTSLAMVQTGLAALLGQAMLSLVTPLGPLGVAAGAYLLSALLTQVMGGQVTALVTGPITISAAIHMGVNPQAVAVATAIGCSASFLTPLAHPVNVLMIAPANYKFKDFFKIGWPLTILSFGMLLLGLILFWKL
ncbi:MAG: SLC13 family permease, partial [Anaerolineae bacterium]|nr:SLC13 family permease [Anaerolineae bacterium]